MEIVTGLTEFAHVTPIDDAVRNSNLGYYSDRVVFNTFTGFEARAITANEVRVYGGYGMNQGRIFKIDEAEYDSVTIENGSQGSKRADLIVARYLMDSQTGFESIELAVIKGTSGNTYTDPSYTTGNMNEGDTQDDFPLYRVKIDGLVIEDVEPLFEALPDGGRLGEIEKKIDDHIGDHTNPHVIEWTEASNLTTMSASDTIAAIFGKIAKAISSLIAHIANKANPHEVKGSQLMVANAGDAVPISKGGTGATTAADALVNLGVPSNVGDAMAKSVYTDSNDCISESKGGIGNRGIDTTTGGTEGGRGVTTAGALYATKTALQQAFQAGVDAIYNAEVAQNVSGVPTASTPTALADGVGAIADDKYAQGETAGYSSGRDQGRMDEFSETLELNVSSSNGGTAGYSAGYADTKFQVTNVVSIYCNSLQVYGSGWHRYTFYNSSGGSISSGNFNANSYITIPSGAKYCIINLESPNDATFVTKATFTIKRRYTPVR